MRLNNILTHPVTRRSITRRGTSTAPVIKAGYLLKFAFYATIYLTK
nr:MAG TPA: hypothetical protein [Bacteriophage sp.]